MILCFQTFAYIYSILFCSKHDNFFFFCMININYGYFLIRFWNDVNVKGGNFYIEFC